MQPEDLQNGAGNESNHERNLNECKTRPTGLQAAQRSFRASPGSPGNPERTPGEAWAAPDKSLLPYVSASGPEVGLQGRISAGF